MLSKIKAAAKLWRTRSLSQTQTPSSNGQTNLNVKQTNESNTIDYQRAETNEEDVTIVWLTKDSKNTKEQSFIESLRSINDYIKVRMLDEYFPCF